jgi:nucleotidyltransferase substrate binding protein (TIGR01987 family)
MLNTTILETCLDTLAQAYEGIQRLDKDSTAYRIYRSAIVKEFELLLEQAGKLLRKRLRPYVSNASAIESLTFKDVFRTAGKYELLDTDAIERWFTYRDSRNDTAHDDDETIAVKTLELLPTFIGDARDLFTRYHPHFSQSHTT